MKKEEELAQYGFDLQKCQTAKRYHFEGVRIQLLEALVTLVSLVLFTLYGSSRLEDLFSALFQHQWLIWGGYISVLFFGLTLLRLPFDWWGELVERRYDLSNQSTYSWISDLLKSFLISGVLFLVLGSLIYYLMSWSQIWWLFAWVLTTVVQIILGFVSPYILLPLFYPLERLEDEDLSSRLNDLAEKAGVDVVGIFRIEVESKTDKAIGGLTGLASSRRIILSDTLIDNFTPEEIETVIAHELGHHIHNDLPKGLVLDSLLALLGFYLLDIFLGPVAGLVNLSLGIQSLPLLMLMLGALFAAFSPLNNAFTRRQEADADRFARRITGKPRPQAEALVKISGRNLADPAPSLLRKLAFYTHPPALDRVRDALSAEPE